MECSADPPLERKRFELSVPRARELLLIAAEKGPEVDHGWFRKARSLLTGDQRFESLSLHQRVYCVPHPKVYRGPDEPTREWRWRSCLASGIMDGSIGTSKKQRRCSTNSGRLTDIAVPARGARDQIRRDLDRPSPAAARRDRSGRSNAIASAASVNINADDGSGTWPITATAGAAPVSIEPG